MSSVDEVIATSIASENGFERSLSVKLSISLLIKTVKQESNFIMLLLKGTPSYRMTIITQHEI